MAKFFKDSDGKLVAAGDGSLVEEINENGFERFLNA